MAETDLVPAGARPSPLSNGMTGLSGLMNQPAVKRSLPLIGLLGALAIAALAWWTFQTPAQRPLFDGLAENDKAAVASALQSAGVNYKLDGASGAISVAEQDFHRARMLLAGQGLPKAAPGGDALISALPMGASRAVEGQTLKSAREADLGRTIEAIDQVASARVHLATPDPSPFVRDAAPPAASVMLRLQPGRSLSEAQVRAIRHLVASSVPGLNADPMTGATNPAIGQFLSILALFLFLASGGHLIFAAIIVESYAALPAGRAWLSQDMIGSLVDFGGLMLAAGLVIALPVTFALVLVQIGMGVLTRSAPALNLFAVGMPAAALAGVILLAIALPTMAGAISDALQQGLDMARTLTGR